MMLRVSAGRFQVGGDEDGRFYGSVDALFDFGGLPVGLFDR